MYSDPSAIRVKRVNLSLNEAELRLVEAVSELNKKQPSAYVRELLMEALERQMHGAKSAEYAM